jgi:hypothetical protein
MAHLYLLEPDHLTFWGCVAKSDGLNGFFREKLDQRSWSIPNLRLNGVTLRQTLSC